MRIGSLFAGIGGFDLAARWMGWETAWFSEVEPYASAVLAKHWPGVPNHGDITRIKGAEVAPVDALCGGFPCQDISLAGKGAGIGGARSGLWSHYARLIDELRPRWVVAENVSALRSRGLDVVLKDLAALRYDAEWHCIPAAAVGAPHRRDRIWVVAYPAELQLGPVASAGTDETRRRCSRALSEQEAVLAHAPRLLLDRSGDTGEEGRPEPADGGQTVADADRDVGHERRSGHTGEGEGRRDAGRSAVGAHAPSWWAIEPDVCLLADGISQELDGSLDGHAINADEACQPIAKTVVRVLRGNGQSGRAPHEWRSDRQLARELTDTLRPLSHALALGEWQATVATASGYMSRLRQACEAIGALRDASQPLSAAWASLSGEEEIWVLMAASRGLWHAEWPDIGRVATKIPARVDRLRCLGNAIVPQVAYLLFSAIQEAEKEMKVAA